MKAIIACMILLLILMALLPSHVPTTMNEYFRTPCKKEDVGVAVLLAMHDTYTSSVVNKDDINVVYSVWSSQMIKRGVPESYNTPQFFKQLHDLHRGGQLSLHNVMLLL